MSKALFWLEGQQSAVIEPFMPKNQPGAPCKDDHRIISGIFHVLKTGCRWQDYPAECGPQTTVYNRFNRWSHKQFWTRMLEALAKAGAAPQNVAMDSTSIKVKRSALGGEGGKKQKIGLSREGNDIKIHTFTDVIGRPFRPLLAAGDVHDVKAATELLDQLKGAQYILGNKGYDTDHLRALIRKQGARQVILGKANRKRKIPLDKARYRSPPRRKCILQAEGLHTGRNPLRQSRSQLLIHLGACRRARLLDLIESGA